MEGPNIRDSHIAYNFSSKIVSTSVPQVWTVELHAREGQNVTGQTVSCFSVLLQ